MVANGTLRPGMTPSPTATHEELDARTLWRADGGAPLVMVPGIKNSGRKHWQTVWQKTLPNATRFRPQSWDEPDLNDWIKALDAEIAAIKQLPILVAHSLGCLLVAHWAARGGRSVRGAFLVCVPNSAAPRFPEAAETFKSEPLVSLPFPALIVASSDDPYASIVHARRRASQWGTGFVVAGDLGHINESSNVREWKQGADLLAAFIAGTH